MFLAKVKQQGKELVMTTNKDCRNAKTAEEYLLQCLFKAEDDRDKAIAYCDEVRAKEDEHKAYIESLGNLPVYDYVRTNAVSAEITSDYLLNNFSLDSKYSFEDMLRMNDEELLKVATDTKLACIKYYGDRKPFIKIKKETFDILLSYDNDEKYYSVARAGTPYSFYDLLTTIEEVLDSPYDAWVKEDLLDDVLKAAVSQLRIYIKKAVEYLNAKKED